MHDSLSSVTPAALRLPPTAHARPPSRPSNQKPAISDYRISEIFRWAEGRDFGMILIHYQRQANGSVETVITPI